MKYIKLFEKDIDWDWYHIKIPYKVGDVVVCCGGVVPFSTLIRGHRYEIVKIENGSVYVNDAETGEYVGNFQPFRFKTEIEYNANKYNI